MTSRRPTARLDDVDVGAQPSPTKLGVLDQASRSPPTSRSAKSCARLGTATGGSGMAGTGGVAAGGVAAGAAGVGTAAAAGAGLAGIVGAAGTACGCGGWATAGLPSMPSAITMRANCGPAALIHRTRSAFGLAVCTSAMLCGPFPCLKARPHGLPLRFCVGNATPRRSYFLDRWAPAVPRVFPASAQLHPSSTPTLRPARFGMPAGRFSGGAPESSWLTRSETVRMPIRAGTGVRGAVKRRVPAAEERDGAGAARPFP